MTMKTSNYILIAFFTFLFGGTFVLFLTAKIYNKTDNSITWTCEEKKLEPFSVVVAEPGADFSLQIECHDPIIRCAHPPKEASVFPPFTVRNDTLFVSALATETEVRTPRVTETEVRTLSVTVRSIKSVIAKEKSYVRLFDFYADSLSVKLTNAASDISFKETKSKAAMLSIQATDSRINFDNVHVNNIDIQISKTRINGWGNSTECLSGTLKDHSFLSLVKIRKINLETDSTSTYQLDK